MRSVDMRAGWLGVLAVCVLGAHAEMRVVRQVGHSAEISDIAMSRDGRFLATASADCTAKLWDVASGKELRAFVGHTNALNHVSFFPDGKRILTGSGKDARVCVWTVTEGRRLHQWKAPVKSMPALCLSPDGKWVAAGGGFFDKCIVVHNADKGTVVRKIDAGVCVTALSFSRDGKTLFSGNRGGTVTAWDTDTGRKLSEGKALWQVHELAVSPDGRFVAVAGMGNRSRKAALLSAKDLGLLHHFPDEENIASISFSPDGIYLATHDSKNTVHVWDVQTGKQAGRAHVGRGPWSGSNNQIMHSPDGRYLVTASGKDAALWESSSMTGWIAAGRDESPLRFSPSGRYIVTDKRLLSSANGRELQKTIGHRGSVESIDASGRYLATGGSDNRIIIWDAKADKQLRALAGHKNDVKSLAFSPDGKLLVSCGSYGDKTTRLWNVASGREIRRLVFDDDTSCVDFCPDGRHFLVAGKLNTGGEGFKKVVQRDVLIFRLGEKEAVAGWHAADAAGRAVDAAVFSPSGKYVLTVKECGKAALWDWRRSKRRVTLDSAAEVSDCAAFDSSGERAAVGYRDGTIRIWSIPEGRLLHTVYPHSKSVLAIAFGQDGKLVISGSQDRRIAVTDARTGRKLLDYDAKSYVDGAAWHPHTGLLMACAGSGLLFWDATTFEKRDMYTVGRSGRASCLVLHPDEKSYAAVFRSFHKNTAYLYELDTGVEIRRFEVEEPGIEAISFDSEGKRLAAATGRSIYVWNTETGAAAGKLALPPGSFCGGFAPGGRWLYAAEKERKVHLWHADTLKPHASLNVPKEFSGFDLKRCELAWSDGGRYLAIGKDFKKDVLVYDLGTGKQIAGPALPDSFETFAFAPGSATLVVGMDKRLARWDASKGRKLNHFEVPSCDQIAVSPDGRWIATGACRALNIWNAHTGKRKEEIKCKGGTIYAIAYAPSGRLLTAQIDDELMPYSLGDEHVRAFVGLAEPVAKVAMADNSARLLTVNEKEAVIWDFANGLAMKARPAFSSPCTMNRGGDAIATREGRDVVVLGSDMQGEIRRFKVRGTRGLSFSADGRLLFSAWYDGGTLWDVKTGRAVADIKQAREIRALAVSPGGGLVGVARETVELWSAKGQFVRNLGGVPADIVHLEFSTDGKSLTVGTREGILTRWSVADRDKVVQIEQLRSAEPMRRLPDKPDRMPALEHLGRRVRPGSIRFLRGGSDVIAVVYKNHKRQVDIWRKGKHERNFGSTEPVFHAAFSPDGTRLMTCSHDARLWDITGTPELVRVLPCAEPRFVCFSPDGGLLAVSFAFSFGVGARGEQDRVALYNPETGERIGAVSGITGSWETPCEMAFDPNGERLAVAGRRAVVWEVEGRRMVRDWEAHAGWTHSVCFSPDGRLLITAGADGCTRFWNAKTFEEIASLMSTGEGGYIVFTPDGYYMSSASVVAGVHYVDGLDTYSFENLDLVYNRPDIVLERIGLSNPSAVRAYRQVVQRRWRRMGYDALGPSARLSRPTVEVRGGTPPPTTAQDALELTLAAADEKTDLKSLDVFANGVPVAEATGVQLSGRRAVKTARLPLAYGPNRIQISVRNRAGVESYRKTVLVRRTGEGPLPRLYVVAVGVSDYQAKGYDLGFAAKDAEDFAGAVRKVRGVFSGVEAKTVLDGQATKDGIRQAAGIFRQSRVDDAVILFLAGHGQRDSSGDYYYATVDNHFRKPKEMGLSYDDIIDLFDGVAARKRLLLMDTCYAGELDEEVVSSVTSQPLAGDPGVLRTRSFRGVQIKPKSADAGRTQVPMREVLRDLRRGTGANVITSSGGAEVAIERGDIRNGVFSFCLLQGIRSGQGDLNKDGEVRVGELYRFVADHVEHVTSGRQRPTFRQENPDADFTLSLDR